MKRGTLRRGVAVLVLLGLGLGPVVACTPQRESIQVEGTASTGAADLALPAQEPEARWTQPFTEREIVRALLRTDLQKIPTAPEAPPDPEAAEQGVEHVRLTTGELRDILTHCNDHCLQAFAPATVEGERLQLVSLTSAAEGWGYAALAVADEGGKPAFRFMVLGDNVALAPGRGGTLVAQEAIYKKDEPVCCPSGWSLRVFRWDGERFVGGQRLQGRVPETKEGS